jgi:transcriptional regulator GlxA family with amidase domain
MSRTIAVVAYPGVEILDVAGPLEVFAAAGEVMVRKGRVAESPYRVQVLAPQAGPLQSQSGIGLVADRALGRVSGGIDTLLVAGGMGTREMATDARVLAWLRRMAPRVRRLGSVCTGTFVLAAAGLLDGRRATTHWAWCDELARAHPRVTVDPDPIFVRDGNVYLSKIA